MDDFERRVQAEIDRLKGPGFATSRRARQMRGAVELMAIQREMTDLNWRLVALAEGVG